MRTARGRQLDLSENKSCFTLGDPPRRGRRRPDLSETKPVSLSNDPPRRGGRGPDLPETIEGLTRISHRGGWASAGKVFVFSMLQRFLGEPSGYKLRWARLDLLGIEHQGRLLPPPARLGGWSCPFPMARACLRPARPRLTPTAKCGRRIRGLLELRAGARGLSI